MATLVKHIDPQAGLEPIGALRTGGRWGWPLGVIGLCGLPLGLMLLGVDFSTQGVPLSPETVGTLSAAELGEAAHRALRGSYTHTLLEWTAFCAAGFVCLLALVQYRLTKHASLPVIGIAMACAGAMDGFHTLAADRLIEAAADNRDLIPFTWAICRLFNALILMIGVGIFVCSGKRQLAIRRHGFIALISVCFVGAAYVIIDVCATSSTLPRTMFPDSLIKRPYDLFPLVPYLICGLYVFPKYLRQHRTAFAYALSLSIIPQVATQLYMAFGSESLFDASFNVSHGLKAVSYLVPVGGLVGEYIETFRHEQRMGDEVQYASARTDAILNATSDGIVTIDERGIIETVNPAVLKLFGYDRDELIGNNINVLMPSPYREEHDGYIQRYYDTGESSILGAWREVVGRRKDGSTFPAELTACEVRFGSTRMSMGHVRDISDRKRAEQDITNHSIAMESANRALEKSNKEAELATKTKSEFLANMSHEIRTPMTAILGYTDNLLDPDLSPGERQDAVETIRRNGHCLLEIINDILDVSKIEAGKLEIEKISCSPFNVLVDVVSTMRVRAEAKHLSLNAEYIGEIPETIQTDPTRLRQILINLVGNAIKFTETGGVRVVARLLPDELSPMMQFEVIDTGIGLTEEQVGKLFQAFMQADASTTRKFGGTGLGLTISKRLVELLGGGIEVECREGEGCTFRATVAIGRLEGVRLLDDPIQIAKASVQKETEPTSSKPLRTLKCRILLAEDGPDNQRLISFVLKKAGAEVHIAENGQIALEQALNARSEGRAFDIILMDMQMPIMDGYTATRRLRHEGYTGPILALTAHAMAEDRQKCLDAGCDEFATKPIDRQLLIDTIAELVDAKDGSAADEAPRGLKPAALPMKCEDSRGMC